MTSSDKIRLMRILETNEISERVISFLWIHLANKNQNDNKNNFEENNNLIKAYRSEAINEKLIADELSRNIMLSNQIKFDLKFKTIPLRHFNWIENSTYQAYWIEQNIIRKAPYQPSPETPEPTPQELSRRAKSMRFLSFIVPDDLIGRNRSIAEFDYWASSRFSDNQDRISCIKEMQADWKRQVEENSILSWLSEGDDKKKRDLFWRCMVTNGISGTIGFFDPNSHDDLLIHLDKIKLGLHEKKYFMLSARRLWNQQQRRENSKDKKQCNFILSKATDTKLNSLAKIYKLTRTEIIELLIDSETEHKTYIEEKLHRTDRLTAPLNPP